MVDENTSPISQGRYWQVSGDKKWVASAERYQMVQKLEDSIFMESDEFERLERIITHRHSVLEFVQRLSEHTWISSPHRMALRKEYFSAKDSLTELGLIDNCSSVRFSDKGRAFLLEYGRRNYSFEEE